MGFFDRFMKPPDVETALRLLQQGREKLWQRQTSEAADLLGKAARCPQTQAVALAYQSLLKRMSQDIPGALKDAEAAIAAKPDLFEAHCARMAALLAGQEADRLTKAMESWNRAANCVPQDVEAHLLKLLMVLLVSEMVYKAKKDASGAPLNMKPTPVVSGAIRLLDGYPDLASKEFAGVDHFGSSAGLAQIGKGIASYRQGRKDAARAAWTLALPACRGQMGQDLTSVERLLAEVGSGPKAP